ncbi:MAG: primosomal protein N' [Gammaproteobacteria bacterium]|nr:primosomal protein N' [Gammaproteobacteria bacterium]
MSCELQYISVVLLTPAYTEFQSPLLYGCHLFIDIGSLVIVPLGRRSVLGVVWGHLSEAPKVDFEIKLVLEILSSVGKMPPYWLNLMQFIAKYYHRNIGEVTINSLPEVIRKLERTVWEKWIQETTQLEEVALPKNIQLTSEQNQALEILNNKIDGCYLLYGSTGSGKTEVYLARIKEVLTADPKAQALFLVPEINLVPQIESRAREALVGLRIAVVHSGLLSKQRFKNWWQAHTGNARLIIGTRSALLCSIPRLQIIVVDEEHDTSYREQQGGVKFSARDIAVYLARQLGIQVILGSATPSLESWYKSQNHKDRLGTSYQLLSMPARIGNRPLPDIKLVDLQKSKQKSCLSNELVSLIHQKVTLQEQVLLILNRRGYAPVLYCSYCGWKSICSSCSVYRVFHKVDYSLRCHHCGSSSKAPKHCPECGNFEIHPVGLGTEQLEEVVQNELLQLELDGGNPCRLMRVDSDTMLSSKKIIAMLQDIHNHRVDVIVSTQVLAKGHDFDNISLVAVLDADKLLYSNDFRSRERLFSLLLQAAGRAGRGGSVGYNSPSTMLIQTSYPQHAFFQYLKNRDFPGFAHSQLEERKQLGLPPFGYHALLRADAKSIADALDFLSQAREIGRKLMPTSGKNCHIFPPIPMYIQKIANVERAQLLIESPYRRILQDFLDVWQKQLLVLNRKKILRWYIDVDPLII